MYLSRTISTFAVTVEAVKFPTYRIYYAQNLGSPKQAVMRMQTLTCRQTEHHHLFSRTPPVFLLKPPTKFIG